MPYKMPPYIALACTHEGRALYHISIYIYVIVNLSVSKLIGLKLCSDTIGVGPYALPAYGALATKEVTQKLPRSYVEAERKLLKS